LREDDGMRISVSADERTGVAGALADELRRRGHEPIAHGVLADGERPDWAWASEAAARDVADGRADQAVVACWTGTGASIAANKVPGIRGRVAAGHLHRIYHGVYAVGHPGLTPEARWLAAVKACGPRAALSHACGGMLFDLLAVDDRRPQVTVPSRRARSSTWPPRSMTCRSAG
jgi:hypothetical protein